MRYLLVFILNLILIKLSINESTVQDLVDLRTTINRLSINLNYDKNQIDLYVASTNHLYKIIIDDTESVRVELDLSTGPRPQKQKCIIDSSSISSSQCIKYTCEEDSYQSQIKQLKLKSQKTQNSIDNENRLLLIDTNNEHLIECGTVDNGGCRVRNLSNLEVVGCNFSLPVIPFNSASGVIVTPSRNEESFLYLMVSNEYNPVEGLDKKDLPIFSMRFLGSKNVEKNQQQPMFYPIETTYDNYDKTIFNSDFHMKIVYSFKHNGFIYFLFTITNKILTDNCNRIDAESSFNETSTKIVTRMLRVCDSKWSAMLSENLQSNQRNNRDSNNIESETLNNLLIDSTNNPGTLTETVIDCEDYLTGSKHNLLQSAYFHELPAKNTQTDDSILFMTFNSTSSSSSSIICKIRIKEIDDHFVTMLKTCLNSDNSYAELVSPYSDRNRWKTHCRCSAKNSYLPKQTVSFDRKLFCHNEFFNYMNSRKSLTVKSINFDTKQIRPITSIVSLNTKEYDSWDNKIVVIISTLDAQIYMLVYDSATNIAKKYDHVNLLKQNSSITLSTQASLNINLALTETSFKQKKKRFLFVTYDRFLFKINLQNCQQFKTCDSCLNGFNGQKISNPFCGWCIYKQECGLRQDCLISNNDALVWLDKGLDQDLKCPTIVDIKPSKFFNPFLDSNSFYEFKLNFKPLLNIDYYCSLNSELIPAIFSPESNLKCDLNKIKSKKVFSKSKFSNLTIEIRTLDSNSLISKANLYAFNCSFFKDCNQCLNKNLANGCTWCAKNSKCVFSNQLSQCTGELDFYQSSSMCTSFSIDSDQLAKRIEIPYTAESNLPQFSILNKHNYQANFKCVFTKSKNLSYILKSNKNIRITTSNLVWLKNDSYFDNKNWFDCSYAPYADLGQIDPYKQAQTIYMSIWWSSKQSQDEAYLKSLESWNQVKFKQEITEDESFLFSDDSNQNDYNFLEINILNCEIKASSCGECMNKRLTDLGCGWCKSLSKCTMKKDCILNSSDWTNDINSPDSYCPNPSLEEMRPRCGPKVSAGTRMSLIGKNLGRNSNEILVKMKPINSGFSISDNSFYSNEDINCQVIEDLYIPASKIVCRTPPISSSESLNLKEINEYTVYVMTNIQSTDKKFVSFNESNQFIFKYITPEINSIAPLKGIRSGGAVLKIVGKHLNCGSEFSINFTQFGTSCDVINVTSSENDDVLYCKTPSFNTETNSKSISTIQIQMDAYKKSLDESKFKFEYVDDPKILNIEPTRSIVSGGLIMSIKGKDLDSVQSANLILSLIPLNTNNRVYSIDRSQTEDAKSILKSKCNIINSTLIQCLLPEIKDKHIVQSYVDYFLQIQFNELENKILSQQLGDLQTIKIYPDPVFKTGQLFSDKDQIILIKGENLLLGVKETDYKVLIGPNTECNITYITQAIIACILPDQSLFKSVKNQEILFRKKRSSYDTRSYEVRVKIGLNFDQTIGFIKFEKDVLMNKYDSIELKYIIFSACLISFVLILIMIGFFIILKRRQNKQIRQLKRMQTEFENLEMRVARECKEAFTELQMDIGELANTLNQTGAPFHDFQTYCMKILFPNASDTEKYYMTTMIDLRLSSANKENVKNGVLMFSQLILNKNFLLNFIHTLEADTHNFLLQDRVNLASYLSICLHDRLDYFTDILMTLLAELIDKVVESKNNPKILFRRNESIAEKMLTNWFAFLLYDFIKECAGTPLYILFLSIKQQIYKGPVDAITCEARYSLSEDKLIRQSIDYEIITIRVQLQDFDDVMHEITVKVLSCDSITQVKEKILDSFFKGYPYSKRPNVDDLDLIYIQSEWNKSGRLILVDEDKTCKIDNDDFKRLNTLAHYKVTNGSLLVLVSRQSYQLLHSSANDACNSYTMLDMAKNAENMTLLSKSSKSSSSPPTYSKLSTNGLNDFNNGGVYSAMNGSSVGLTENLYHQNNSTRLNSNNSHHQLILNKTNTSIIGANNNKLKRYHLIKSNDLINTTPCIKDDKKQEIAAKLVSEVYLTRLLATKGGMQSYVDDFFETVFSTAHGSNVLPYAIKYLFDFLDEQANLHGITDPDVVYTWKSNSLPLRFWVNIIKNPDFVFDIFKSNIVDASLSVIASTFMDSCSQSKLDLNKESPSGKLLFYKEVHKYRKWVESYYTEIKLMPKINELDMSEMLAEESKKHSNTFNKNNSMYKLYNDYIKKYRAQIENNLNNDYQEPSIISINKHLNYRLQQVIYLMDAIEV